VKHEELGAYYRNASILVVPSYYESFGLVALEAMASARPVVGFKDTGLAETVEDNAGILVERNAKNLAQALGYLVDRHDECSELGSMGRRKAERFSWEAIAKRYGRTYGEICKD
jgi:D-inositol-3-phosphate glycosyltransferase